MVKVISTLSFNSKIYVYDVVSSWYETYASSNEEYEPLQACVRVEYYYEAGQQQTWNKIVL